MRDSLRFTISTWKRTSLLLAALALPLAGCSLIFEAAGGGDGGIDAGAESDGGDDGLGEIITRGEFGAASDSTVVWDGSDFHVVWMDISAIDREQIYASRMRTNPTVPDPLVNGVSPTAARFGDQLAISWIDEASPNPVQIRLFDREPVMDEYIATSAVLELGQMSSSLNPPALSAGDWTIVVGLSNRDTPSIDVAGIRLDSKRQPPALVEDMSWTFSSQKAPALGFTAGHHGIVVQDPDTPTEITLHVLNLEAAEPGCSVEIPGAVDPEEAPVITKDGAAGFGVLWKEGSDLLFSQVSPMGCTKNGPSSVTRSPADPSKPAIVALAGGDYAAAWQDDRQSPAAIYFQRFNPNGQLVGDEMSLSEGETGEASDVSLAASNTGLGVSWTSESNGQTVIKFRKVTLQP